MQSLCYFQLSPTNYECHITSNLPCLKQLSPRAVHISSDQKPAMAPLDGQELARNRGSAAGS